MEKKNSLNIVVKCAYLGNDFIEYDRTFLKLIQLARDRCKRLKMTSMRVVCLKKNGRILCSQLLGKICNRNSNEWSLIWSVIIRVITESDDRALFMTSITDRSGRHDESRGINY